ncbi:hypothetical protein BJX99DRAFT_263129 [Aspergillus californicus]
MSATSVRGPASRTRSCRAFKKTLAHTTWLTPAAPAAPEPPNTESEPKRHKEARSPHALAKDIILRKNPSRRSVLEITV